MIVSSAAFAIKCVFMTLGTCSLVFALYECVKIARGRDHDPLWIPTLTIYSLFAASTISAMIRSEMDGNNFAIANYVSLAVSNLSYISINYYFFEPLKNFASVGWSRKTVTILQVIYLSSTSVVFVVLMLLPLANYNGLVNA